MIKISIYARLFTMLAALMISGIASAALPQWQIAVDQSSVTFTATQNNAPVTGQFKTFSGDIQFDPNQLNDSHAQIVIDTNSVASSYSELTETLKSADWFDVKQFPQATFKAMAFKKIGDKIYQVDGALTIRDKSAPTSIMFTLDDYTPTKLHLTGATTIKRSTFGVGRGDWAKFDTVKDEVQVKFVLVANSK